MQMTVDFNNSRINLAREYNRLCAKMNDSISDNPDETIKLEPDEIRDEMDGLRSQIATICSLYEDNNKDCRSVLNDIGQLQVLY